MRLTITILMIGQLLGCDRSAVDAGESEEKDYQPRPVVEFSTLMRDNRVAAVSIRHSRCSLLLHLKPGKTATGAGENDHKMVLRLDSVEHPAFTSGPYENFDESLDLFQDGRVVLVRLPETGGKAAGAFLNLPSRRRVFFFPPVQSSESLASIEALRKRRLDIKVVGPEDTRAFETLVRLPEFRQ